MIKISHLSKKYENTIVLNDINLSFPRTGIVVLFGPSGCGKTTLLNCISGLTDYEGSVSTGSVRLETMNEKEKSLFRLKTYGFIFQDFKLFNNETVEQNILFPLETLTNMKVEKKKRKTDDLLGIVNLQTINKKTYVSNLSGGEKQRVAIARSLANDPQIILADEPTGSLDIKNGIEVMEIFAKVSTKALIVIVSHDRELAEKYADYIVEMKDGKVVSQKAVCKHRMTNYIPVLKNSNQSKTPKIPFHFLVRHSYFAIKKRRWRTMFCNGITSLGLIGVGLSIVLTSSISEIIKNAYSDLVEGSDVIISIKDNPTIRKLYAGSYYEALDLKEQFPDLIYDVGQTYYADFESFFPQTNNMALANSSKYCTVGTFSARHINEYEWLDLYPNLTLYPSRPSKLNDDEIVVSLTIDAIRSICFDLQIERTVTSFSNYLYDHQGLNVYFDFRNDNWQYSDQQLLTIRAFSLGKENVIYHYSHSWNEYIFEEMMCFPTNDVLNGVDSYPWVMKKIPYFETVGYNEELISLSLNNEAFDSFTLDIADTSFYPWLYLDKPIKERTRVLFFSSSTNYISPRVIPYFQEVSEELLNPIYGTPGGYAIYPESFLMGFSKETYFCSSQTLCDETIDSLTSRSQSSNESTEIKNGVLLGYYAKTAQNGVIFRQDNGKYLYGRSPQTLDEICISSAMAVSLFGTSNAVGKIIYLAYNNFEKYLSNGSIRKNFISQTITVSGIIDSSRHCVYHKPEWTISFFQVKLGISAFSLGISSVAFELKSKSNINETIKALNRAFPSYKAADPLSDVASSVDEMCSYIRIALLAFSMMATLISILLLTICNYLHALENRHEIGLSRCIGVTRSESKKFLLSHSLVLSMISFFLSSIELFIASFFVSYEISNSMGTTFHYSFQPLSLVAMFALAVTVSLLSSLIIAGKTSKMNPLEALKK